MRRIATATLGFVVFAALVSSAAANVAIAKLASIGPTGGNAPIDVEASGHRSEDGKHFFFQTSEALVAADTDASLDIYDHSEEGTTLVSTGPAGGNGPFDASQRGSSADGTHAFFITSERLVSEDTDSMIDTYERFDGTTMLVSTGPNGGNGAFDAIFTGRSDDGSRVFFWTREHLVTEDSDTATDVYERSAGVTTLVSTGPAGGNGAVDAFLAASWGIDGTRAFFSTAESLVPEDTDNSVDVYERSGGTTTLVTTGPAGGNGPYDITAMLWNQNGGRITFTTAESLVSGDSDTSEDIYERFAGTTSLVSTGPSGGNGPFDVLFGGWSPHQDGTHIYFATEESLVSEDTDAFNDIYERSGGVTRLISTGPTGGNGAFYTDGFASASDDGMHVFFMTSERLVSRDTDDSLDVYKRSGGTTTLVSAGPTGGNGPFDAEAASASSPDGTRIFFSTRERLVKADTDNSVDIYAHIAGRTKLVTLGPTGGNGAFDTFISPGASLDLTTLAFATSEALVSKDTDASLDIYTVRIDP